MDEWPDNKYDFPVNDDEERTFTENDVFIVIEITNFSSTNEELLHSNIYSGSSHSVDKVNFAVFLNFFDVTSHINNFYNYERYVSIVFQIRDRTETDLASFSLAGTISVEDDNGDLRFPKSFAAEWAFDIDNKFPEGYRFGLERYVKKSTLFNNPGLLSDDILKLRCEIKLTFGVELPKRKSARHRPVFFNLQNKWFRRIHDDKTGKTKLYFKLDGFSDSVRESLCGKSDYFQRLFQTSMVEKDTQLLLVEDGECEAFFDLVICAWSEDQSHIDTAKKVFDLYVVADKYMMENLCRKCYNYLKRYLLVGDVDDNFVADICTFTAEMEKFGFDDVYSAFKARSKGERKIDFDFYQ